MALHTGRHFLQIPGPTNVPDRVLRAIDAPVLDHRGPEFQELGLEILQSCRPLFGAKGPVIIFPSSGTGATEAALVNTLSPGDKLLMVETGQFAVLWKLTAERLGLKVDFVPGDWRHGVNPAEIEARLKADKGHEIKALAIVHNETSTGILSDVAAVRKAIDAAGHPALLMVDVVSSVGSIAVEHDAWGIDVTVAGSQKGLMLPPGMAFNAVSAKAIAASKQARMPRAYWDWTAMLDMNASGWFPYTPNTNLLYGFKEAVAMLNEEGLENVFARHRRHGEATRRAARAWGLENVALNAHEFSPVLTAVMLPEGHDADAFRATVLKAFDMSLGMGLGKVKGRAFRIGHVGHFNDLMLMGTLAGVEMGLQVAGVPHKKGGVEAAMAYLADTVR